MTKVIAEVGNNHLGSVELALAHVDAASRAKADIVKFQYIIPENVIVKASQRYQHVSSTLAETQYERWKRVCLDGEQLQTVRQYCIEKNIEFMCTPFCYESLEWVADNCDRIKIASSDSMWWDFVDKCIDKDKEILASTGVSSWQEICELAQKLPEGSTIFHCISEYPTPIEHATFGDLKKLQEFSHIKVGLSDHTVGTLAPIMVSAHGLSYIEKHFILSRTIPGGDKELSVDEQELAEICQAVRLSENFNKTKDWNVELRPNFARGLYYRKSLQSGTVLSDDDIIALRPGKGCDFNANEKDKLLGKVLKHSVLEQGVIKKDDF